MDQLPVDLSRPPGACNRIFSMRCWVVPYGLNGLGGLMAVGKAVDDGIIGRLLETT